MPKHIVIVNYAFPPNPGIGGRRWAKLAKQFIKNGDEVSVICKNFPNNSDKSVWTNDVKGVSYFPINIRYPGVLVNPVKNFSDKVLYRVSYIILKGLIKGNYFDLCAFWKAPILTQLQKLHQEKKIDVLITSGAPFNLLYFGAIFKKKNPEVKVIGDYRDPWLTARNYGISILNKRRKEEEIRKQNFILENIDYITAPNEFMLKQIQSEYSGNLKIKSEFYTIPHSFDWDDYKQIHLLKKETSNKLHFVYAGTLYHEIEHQLKEFKTFLNRLKSATLEFQVDFYTNELDRAKEFTEYKEVKFHTPLRENLFETLSHTDCLLIFLADHNKDFCTTKFYEFLPLNKPYLLFGPEGFVSNTIINNKLGYHHSEKKTQEIISEIQKKQVQKNNLDTFSLNFIFKKFISEIID